VKNLLAEKDRSSRCRVSANPTAGEHAKDAHEELLRIRHYSLFRPHHFDISPYFAIVKPTLVHDFD